MSQVTRNLPHKSFKKGKKSLLSVRERKRLGLYRPLTRRDFIKGMTVGAGCLVLPGCSGSTSDPDTPPTLTSPPSPHSFFAGYDLVVACDPSGVVQPVVYGAEQFRRMLQEPNGLALEVMADGLFLAGDEAFRQEIEEVASLTRKRLGIERTPTGWRMTHPESIRQ